MSTNANSPIYVIEPTKFGGFKDSDIPVVIGYNQVHYESLHPITDEDREKTILLAQSFISGNYEYNKNHINHFISDGENKEELNGKENVIVSDDIHTEFSTLKKIKPALRTPAQKKRLKNLYYHLNKINKTLTEKSEPRKKKSASDKIRRN